MQPTPVFASQILNPHCNKPDAAEPDATPRAHNISFFAAPVREERKAAEATEHLATFFLGREEYGVDVRLVQEIIRVSEITQVPRAPEFIKGAQERAKVISDKWIKDATAKGIDGAKVFAEFHEELKRVAASK